MQQRRACIQASTPSSLCLSVSACCALREACSRSPKKLTIQLQQRCVYVGGGGSQDAAISNYHSRCHPSNKSNLQPLTSPLLYV